LCSGTLALIVFGSIYTFGALTPYISSYLYYQKDETSSAAMSILFTLTLVVISVGVAISSMFLTSISNRILCMAAVLGMSASVFVASFMTTFAGYVFFYGVCYGFSIGIGYFPPLKNCYLHLPKQKGLCAGICMSGFGLGSALFNYVIVALVNPDDVSVDSVTKKYPEAVANNLPAALKILAGIYVTMGLLGSIFITPPKQKK
jgi:MFS family permease